MSPTPTRRAVLAFGVMPIMSVAAGATDPEEINQAEPSPVFAALQQEIETKSLRALGAECQADVLKMKWRELCGPEPLYLDDDGVRRWKRREGWLRYASGYDAAIADADQAWDEMFSVEKRMVALPAVTLADVRLKAMAEVEEKDILLAIRRDLDRMLEIEA